MLMQHQNLVRRVDKYTTADINPNSLAETPEATTAKQASSKPSVLDRIITVSANILGLVFLWYIHLLKKRSF